MMVQNIGSNYGIVNSNAVNSKPSFKGALDDSTLDKTIEKISKASSGVMIADSMDDFIEEMDKFAERSARGSVGVLVVANKDLPKLLKDDFDRYDTDGKLALCLAAGNCKGYVENMTHIFDAKVVLIDENKIKK